MPHRHTRIAHIPALLSTPSERAQALPPQQQYTRAHSSSAATMPKKWLPLESNPEVMTEFAGKIGLDVSRHAFHDVLGLDPEVGRCSGDEQQQQQRVRRRACHASRRARVCAHSTCAAAGDGAAAGAGGAVAVPSHQGERRGRQAGCVVVRMQRQQQQQQCCAACIHALASMHAAACGEKYKHVAACCMRAPCATSQLTRAAARACAPARLLGCTT